MLGYYKSVTTFYLNLRNLEREKDTWFLIGITFAALLGSVLGLAVAWFYITLILINNQGIIH